MYAPAQHDEITGLVGYLDQQLAAIRAATYGLTEDQARATPCRSTLSVGGIVKHAAHIMWGAVERLRDGVVERPVNATTYAAFVDSFTVGPEESVAATIADFDRARAELLAVVAATDPDGDTTEPPAPWYGVTDARPIRARYYLVHLIEEHARHAGHVDIIREQIDGVSVPDIVLTLDGAEANDFFRPYRAAPGTLLAGPSS